jgi:hypothetical protein
MRPYELRISFRSSSTGKKNPRVNRKAWNPARERVEGIAGIAPETTGSPETTG